MSSQYLNRPALLCLCLLLPAALLAETESPYEFTVAPVSSWHSGILTMENCGWNFGCSRLTYPREFATYGVGLFAKKAGSSLEWGAEVTGTGRRISQPSIRDEDWGLGFGLARHGPKVDVQSMTLRDTPYSFEGGQKTNDAYAEARLNQYAVLGSVRWAVSHGLFLVGQAGYQYSDYRRFHAVTTGVTTRGRWSYPQDTNPDAGSFTVQLQEVRLGLSYSGPIGGPLSVRLSALPSLAYARSRDNHGPYNATVWRLLTWGAGAFVDAALAWGVGEHIEIEGSGWVHHLYTRGVEEAVGLKTQYISVLGGGQDINLKERGGSLRISVRL